jgi:pimeloyl-ACP methyl ester carboxylesterase
VALADALAPAGHPAVLIGHDWGAICSYGATVHRPDRFQRLVAMSVPHGATLGLRLFTDPAQLKRSWYIFFFQLPLAEMGVTANDFAVIDKLWRDWSPGYEPPPGYLAALKETLASPGVLEAAIGYYRALINPLKQDSRLAAVQSNATAFVPVPTLYLHGEDDGCIGADLVDPEALKQLFPAGIEIGMVPGSGHFLHLEDPAVNRRIVEFVSAVS